MFEYDAAKSAANKAKHGIDFVEAQILWTGITVQIPARSADETRTIVVGMIGPQYWTAIVTQRGENTRIISVRHSRTDEIEVYENAKNKADR